MQQENDDNVQKINPPDTRRFEAEDDDGHIKGSHEAGSSSESLKKEREKDEKDQSSVNKPDARGTLSGDEII